MSLTYAGVPFDLPTPEWAEWISQYHDLSEIPIAQMEGWNGGDLLDDFPRPPHPSPRPLSLCELNWPTGASRPATFHGLMTATQLDAVREVIAESGPYQPLVMFEPNTEQWIVAAGMRMSPPLPLHQIAGREQLYLVTLWDQRAWWYWRDGTIGTADSAFVETALIVGTTGTEKIEELRADGSTGFPFDTELTSSDIGLTETQGSTWDSIGGFDYLTGRLESEDDLPPAVPGYTQLVSAEVSYTTWEDLYHAVGNLLGVTIHVDPVSPNYGIPSARWQIPNRPLPMLLDAIATACGQKIVVRLDGTVYTVNWQTAIVSALVEDYFVRKMAGGLIAVEDIYEWVPAAITVVRGTVDPDTGLITAIDQSTDTLVSLGVPGYEDATGLANTTVTLQRDFLADPLTSDPDPTGSFTAQVAYDWYGWQLAQIDKTLPGIWNWVPTGAEDRLLWTYQPGRILTRIIRGPWLDLPIGWLEIGGATTSGDGTTIELGCEPHGWLSDRQALIDMATADPKRVLTYEVFDGATGGRCACIHEQGRDTTSVPYPYTAFYDSTKLLWVGSIYIDTCCGCARLEIDIKEDNGDDVDDWPPIKATLYLNGTCDSSGRSSFPLKFQCASDTSAIFAGSGPEMCDGVVPFPCDNSFIVKINCADCTMNTADCADGCQETCAPPLYRINVSGFSDSAAIYNGDWFLPFVGNCTWQFSCNGIEITLTIVHTGDYNGDTTITVTFGGAAVYSATSLGERFACFNNGVAITLDRDTGDPAKTPATIDVTPFYCDSCPPLDCLSDFPQNLKVTASSSDVPCIDGWTKNLDWALFTSDPACGGQWWSESNFDPPCVTDTGFSMTCCRIVANSRETLGANWNGCGPLTLVDITLSPFSVTWSYTGTCGVNPAGTIIFVVTEQ